MSAQPSHPQSGATVVDRLAHHFPFVARMGAAGRAVLAQHGRARAFEPGTLLLEEGAPCPDLVLVVDGHLRVFKSSDTGREITLYRVYPGDGCVLSISSVLSGAPYPAHVSAPVATQAVVVPAAQVRALYAQEPAVQDLVTQDMAFMLAEMMTLVSEVAFRKMDARLATLLLAESTRAAGGTVTLSHEEMALHLGTAREVVSRLVENLRADGVLAGERRALRILRPAALAELAALHR